MENGEFAPLEALRGVIMRFWVNCQLSWAPSLIIPLPSNANDYSSVESDKKHDTEQFLYIYCAPLGCNFELSI